MPLSAGVALCGFPDGRGPMRPAEAREAEGLGAGRLRGAEREGSQAAFRRHHSGNKDP